MVFQRTIGRKNEDFLSELKEEWMDLRHFTLSVLYYLQRVKRIKNRVQKSRVSNKKLKVTFYTVKI